MALDRTIPIAFIIFQHFMLYYLINLCFKDKQKSINTDISQKIIKKEYSCCTLSPILGIELLLVQLLFSIYLGMAFEEVYVTHPYYAQFLCLIYPFGVGTIKFSQAKMVEKYKVETLYEFLSLGLAALPYKFIFLNIDLPLVLRLLLLNQIVIIK